VTASATGPRRGLVRAAALILAALSLGARGLTAQTAVDGTRASPAEPSVVSVGSRVRLWEHAAADLSVPIVGQLTAVARDTVGVRPDGGTTAIGIARPSLVRIESSVGPQSASRAGGAWKGVAAGGLGGGLLGVIVGSLARRNAAKLGLYSAGIGAVIGAGAGATWPGEAWHRASLPDASLPDVPAAAR